MASKAFALCDDKQYEAAKTVFEDISRGDIDEKLRDDSLFNAASCLASEGRYDEALKAYSKIEDTSNDLLYNIALCQYKQCKFDVALQSIDELMLKCRDQHPEYFIRGDQLVPQTGNAALKKLQKSLIIETINLKAAVQYKINKTSNDSYECLSIIPISNSELFDSITLHNQAIYQKEGGLGIGLEKLDYLISLSKDKSSLLSDQVPLETFRNRLILTCGSSNDGLEFIQANRDKIRKIFSENELKFIEILSGGSSDELLYKKLDKLVDDLSSNSRSDDEELISAIISHESLILWRNNQYELLEKLLLKVGPKSFADGEVWKKNLAHSIFMQDTRFENCVQLYEELLPKSRADSLLQVDPFVLGCLCVAYVLTGRNGEAESLIKDVESDELSGNDMDSLPIGGHDFRQAPSTLAMINLIIGTLYCIKYNYEFGLSRMFKTLVPVELKLDFKSWFYIKRCIVSLLDCHCKQMIFVKDDLFEQVVSFLIQCEKYGATLLQQLQSKAVTTTDTIESSVKESKEQEMESLFHGRLLYSLIYEARYLRSIVLTIIHD